MTPNLVLQTLRTIWEKISQSDYPVALAGGLVLPIWNYPRSTQDIDLLVAIPSDAELMRLCTQLDCHPRRTPAIQDLGNIRVLQTEYCPRDEYVDIAIDFLLCSSEFHRTSIQRAVPVHLDSIGCQIKVVSCEDLILLKLQSGRMIDLADCQRLIEINRATLDWTYLRNWSVILEVEAELQQTSV